MICQNCGTEIPNSRAKFCPKCGATIEQPEKLESLTQASLPDISSVWSEWQVEKEIGKGSYGDVYRVVRRDNNVESHAAIKIISIPSAASEVDSLRSEGLDMDGTRTYFRGIVDDFVSEIRLMESLKGIQNIVSVEDYKVVEKTGSIGWDIYIRMELLTPFNTYICDKTLTEEEIIKLGCDICTALEICGQRNIIHRDIKPENIFVNDFGYFKLGDFGIARKLENMTGGLSQKGTFNYMAPEVANSNEYDARVDTYSLGIVLYRLLNNNKLPFLDTEKQLLSPNERKNAVERRMRGEELPAPCNASPEMANVILRACAYEPSARFDSATEMKQALVDVANGTYKVLRSDLDKTTSVRTADANFDATTAVRKARTSDETSNEPAVDTFGDKSGKKANKGKKTKIITIAVLAAIITLAITLAIFFFTSAAYGVYRDMKTESFEDALSDYHAEIEDNFIQKMLMDVLLKDRVDEVVTEYKNGEITFDSAISELNALYEMGFDGAKEKTEEITMSNDAANALEKADEYYENGDYENAISEYSKIPESDENYDEAQTKLNEICPKYISSVVEKATEYNFDEKYKEAVSYINTAYDVLPEGADTTELDKIKSESLAFYKTEVSNEVTELINESNFTEAFGVIDEAIEFNDDEYFTELRATTEGKYVESVATTVQKHLDNEDYISAKRVVENAINVLPSNSDLKQLKKDVEDNTPTYLLDVCKPYESDGYAEFVNGETITMGGSPYTNAFILEAYYSSPYAIYNLNGKYSTLNFNLGHVDGSAMNDVTVKIYFDGILQKELVVKSEALPQRVSLDVTGVKQLKFEVSYCHSSTKYGFGNVTVK